MFSSQLQGARDSTRINELALMNTAVSQYHADASEYPQSGSNFTGQIDEFVSKTLADPKAGVPTCWDTGATTQNTSCNGYYGVEDDLSSLPRGRYKLAVRFEKKSNERQGEADGGTSGSGYIEKFGGKGGSGVTLELTTAIY